MEKNECELKPLTAAIKLSGIYDASFDGYILHMQDKCMDMWIVSLHSLVYILL